MVADGVDAMMNVGVACAVCTAELVGLLSVRGVYIRKLLSYPHSIIVA